MKKAAVALLAGFVALACSVSSAFAGQPYLSGRFAVSMLSDSEITPASYDAGYTLAGAVGLDKGRYRIEAELGRQSSGVSKSLRSLVMTTYMSNLSVDLDLPLAPLEPFITAGVGLANVEEDDGIGGNVDDMVFAWQIGAGVGFDVAPLVTLDVQYRYLAATDPELAGHQKYTIDNHNVVLGLRAGF
jgi:opacity protein-like surface antigen